MRILLRPGNSDPASAQSRQEEPLSKIHFCVVLGGVLFALVGYTAAQPNEGGAPAGIPAAEAAPGLSVGLWDLGSNIISRPCRANSI